ncbi:peptidoglycan-binding protein [Micromonospora sp. LAH09]|uniref:helix-turn-helix domain-containing protein n=1 Tax=Micromonospora cabrerizensis TaxID=2911213 RepID=UPI001EE86172|nr:peptidoglycan-binding protein [Micromonospora cabrerizensis]MCG5471985.1 peptidoglycan-binding protein [Micromonospora cabrerizensis]
MDDAAWDQLTQVATAGEYVALLRDVRRRSGLTYREIARLASAAGHWLPPSTLATMLGRTTLPRERTVVALLVACGTTAADVERWVEARRDIEARLGERDRWENHVISPASSPPAAPQLAVDGEPAANGESAAYGEPGTNGEPAAHSGPTAHSRTAAHGEPVVNGRPVAHGGPAGSVVVPVRPALPRATAPWPTRRWLRLAVLAVLGVLMVGASGVLLPGAAATVDSSPSDGCPLVLRQGMYGPCVLDLQERLVAGGLNVRVDGWFGPDTTGRLIVFQAFGGLPVNGTADRRVLDELSGATKVPPTWTEDRIGKELRRVFPEDPGAAVQLARCLSGLDPYRVEIAGDGSRRWGLFQFSDTELSRLGVDRRAALEPGWSIGAARHVWSSTGDLSHWRCDPSS